MSTQKRSDDRGMTDLEFREFIDRVNAVSLPYAWTRESRKPLRAQFQAFNDQQMLQELDEDAGRKWLAGVTAIAAVVIAVGAFAWLVQWLF